MMRLVLLALLLAQTARPQWIVEQKFGGDRLREAIGKSALKESWFDGDKLQLDTIVDFAAGTLTKVDHEKKTIARISLAEYLEKESARRPPDAYAPAGAAEFAGLACKKFSYSYSNNDASGISRGGGWGGGTGCFTTVITVPPPYDQQFARYLQVSERHNENLGFTLWYQAYRGGPPRVVLETVSAKQVPVAPEEFLAPAAYKSVPFTWN